MPKLVTVYFRKSPTGAFRLAYHKGDYGLVRPQMAEALLKAGYIDPINIEAPTDDDYKPMAKIEKQSEPKAPDLSTKEGVKATFGDDIEALRKYCDENDIKVHNAVKRPETFWAKIAKHHKK
jgi:hypothetical protein